MKAMHGISIRGRPFLGAATTLLGRLYSTFISRALHHNLHHPDGLFHRQIMSMSTIRFVTGDNLITTTTCSSSNGNSNSNSQSNKSPPPYPPPTATPATMTGLRGSMTMKELLSLRTTSWSADSSPISTLLLTRISTVADAIDCLSTSSGTACIVVEDEKNATVVGIVSERDILRFLHKYEREKETEKEKETCIDKEKEKKKIKGGKEPNPASTILNFQPNPLQFAVASVMAPLDQVVCCKLEDSVERCLELMLLLGVDYLPVLDASKCEIIGVVGLRSLLGPSFWRTSSSGRLDKKRFLDSIGSKKILTGAKVSARNSIVPSINLEVASFLLPNPFKTDKGVSASRYDHGHNDLCEDIELTEDASFVHAVKEQIYFGIADGVGSWRDLGIDPRNFSRALVKNSLEVLQAERIGIGGNPAGIIPPLDIMQGAWTKCVAAKILGSSTFCVATVDRARSLLHYSNIGDGGLVVLRQTDTSGSGANKRVVAHMSRQQSRSFNLPYQLGFCDVPKYPSKFESPRDADTSSVSVISGDIVVLATDGIYDNIDLDEVADEVARWEAGKTTFASPTSPTNFDASKSLVGLAEALVRRARVMSLEKGRDSPFALLAKENDIMWGGGMPDDSTVIVLKITN